MRSISVSRSAAVRLGLIGNMIAVAETATGGTNTVIDSDWALGLFCS